MQIVPTEALTSNKSSVAVVDTTNHTIADTLSNLSLSDLKDIVAGDNTLLKDGLSEIIRLTVESFDCYHHTLGRYEVKQDAEEDNH